MAIHANSTPVPALPAVAIPATIYRALTVYDQAPPGCSTFPVPHDRFAPHLRTGEWAIIDPDDREPVTGEIYVVTIQSPRSPLGVVFRIVQIRPASWNPEHWMLHFDIIQYRRGLTADEMTDLLASGQMSLCDGPISDEGMRSKIVGRVVGVILSVDA